MWMLVVCFLPNKGIDVVAQKCAANHENGISHVRAREIYTRNELMLHITLVVLHTHT